ncbi:MAG: TIGR02281 family clan AA aspartic protease [Devosia sp.]|jgi:aspartyl protease family protein|uniref:retropepsin-like aspartic protease family protein n=1 Tax=unclassified Devosia TaxID=196773 RepID=UPI001A0E9933|nr:MULTISPECIES: TIGR02281 family clan AA aspartic protease [unclassified Devosia]MBF0678412.1 TIGR02281 family clan AA aspartic protease [Devosia sp.]WEJ32332.1 TIGR02281 family clan AA aspartic protease [Devosia sp. SD17-2]
MIFIGLALLIAVGIALMISADAGTMVGLTQTQTAQLVPLLIILIVIAGGLFSRRRQAGELVGALLLWIGIFATVGVGYAYRDDLLSVVSRVSGELRPGVAIVDGERGSATFRRGLSGHFEISATINGHETPMIFDTGASAVVLTQADAAAAGIDVDNLRFAVPVSTANGMGMAARTRIATLEVGGIVRQNVIAFVTERGALETSLLGMTFLETLSRYSVTQNSLEMEN